MSTHVLEGLDVVDEDVLVAADEGAEELAEPVQLVQARADAGRRLIRHPGGAALQPAQTPAELSLEALQKHFPSQQPTYFPSSAHVVYFPSSSLNLH